MNLLGQSNTLTKEDRDEWIGNVAMTGLMKSGFLTLQGRGVKHKEGLNDTTLATECGTNIVSNDQSFLVMNTSGNLIGGSFKVVKDGMEYGFVDPKVMKGVDEPVSTIPKSFASLVTNEVVTVDWELKEEMVIVIPSVEGDGEVLHNVQFKPKKPIWQDVSKKNSASSSGDELRSNRGLSNSVKKVVQDVAGSTSSSPSNTPLVTRINGLKSQMIERTLVLLDDDGKPLKHSKSAIPSYFNVVYKKVDDMVNEDNDIEVEDLPLLWLLRENHGEDPYDDDDFDYPGLTDAQMNFANAFDINLRGQLR
ncbi:hypothetical protein Tco_0318866 [Tanacetum coccineum]